MTWGRLSGRPCLKLAKHRDAVSVTNVAGIQWVSTQECADALGIHPQTLRKLRRSQINLFKEGRDYRWVGLSTSSHLQWNVLSASRTYTDFRRMPPEAVETYSRSHRVRSFPTGVVPRGHECG